MSRRELTCGAVILALGAALGARSEAAPEEVAVGAIRAIVKRDGSVLRAESKALAAVVTTLAHGTRVRVVEAKYPWLRVATVPTGGAAEAEGWVKALETVEPYALTESGKRGPVAAGGGRTAVSSREISAAGRQLDATAEEGFRASNAAAARAYPLLDRLESASRALDQVSVEEFILRGRLGRP